MAPVAASRAKRSTSSGPVGDTATRILDATLATMADHGIVRLSLEDVARRAGLTRQTVYRYFPNADALLMASGMRAVDGLIDQAVQRASGQNDPVIAVIECVAVGIENLAGDPQLEGLLARRQEGDAVVSLTADTAIEFCLSVFQRLDVDWTLHGFDTAGLRELAEMTLRTVQSLLTDPGQRSLDGIALRRFIARWLGPAILYPRIASLYLQRGEVAAIRPS